VRAEQAQLRAVEQLHRHAPWLLVRLFAALQQDGAAYSRFVENADDVLLRCLLESYFQLSHHPQHRENSDFRRAITQHAATVQDGRLFYSYLLGALLNDELIDFERFTDNAAAHSVSAHRIDAASPQYNEANDPSDILALGESQAPFVPVDEADGVSAVDVAGDDTGNKAGASRETSRLLELLNTLNDTRQLVERLDDLLAHYPQQTRGELLAAIKERAMLERLVQRLPEPLLGQLLPLVSASAAPLYRSAELLSVAASANSLGLQRHDLQRIKWLAIYAYVAQTGSLFDSQAFVRAYLEEVTLLAGQRALSQLGLGIAEALKRQAVPATQRATYQLLNSLAAVLPEMKMASAEHAGAQRSEADLPAQDEVSEVAFADEIYIENAGLVLAAPYLPMLFDRLGLMKARQFNDSESAEFAIHVLQYLVSAELESAEYTLVLNKLLCGVEPEQTIPRGISMTDEQRGQVDGLLTAMIQHWTTLGNTSIAGLRETFLNRPGTLRLQDDAWRLKVEERAFDVLLDRIPWSYSTIKYPWMQRVIYVEWR
jgi:hypothetical protein